MNTETNSQDQGKEAKKVLSNFDNVVKKLTAVVNGGENLKPVRKVKQDATKKLVEDLFKEENEAKIEEVKGELKSLLKGYVSLNNTLAEERKKLDNLEISKKKEFNTTAAKLFAKIDGIDSMTQEFYGAMDAAQDAVIAEEEQTED